MKIKNSFSAPGQEINEDYVIASDDCIGILDGSSGLRGENFGAEAFVTDFAHLFTDELKTDRSLSGAINRAIYRIKEKNEYANSEIPPSASVILVQEIEDSIQLLTIGDCFGIIFYKNGDKQIVFSSEVERFDNAVIKRLEDLRKITGRNVDEILATDEIQQLLIANRKMMNTPEGYRILAPNMKEVTEEDVITVFKNQIDSIVLLSDGFSSQFEKIFNGEKDLDALYQEMREQEQMDFHLNENPRFKVSDDASAVIIGL